MRPEGLHQMHHAARRNVGVHTLSVLVENRPGVLARISGMFARRSMNIESLAVGPTEDDRVSRMTIVLRVEAQPLDVMIHQLDKLVNVIHIQDLPTGRTVERVLSLVKVSASAGTRSHILEIANIFRAKIVDAERETLALELAAPPDNLEAFMEMLRPYGVLEVVRTGTIALERGAGTIHDSASSVTRVDEVLADT